MYTLIVRIVGGQFRHGGNSLTPTSADPLEAAPPSGAGSEVSSSEDRSVSVDGDAHRRPRSRRARSGRSRRPVYGGAVEEISLLPGAVLEYPEQIKKLATTPEHGALLAFTLRASISGGTELNVTYEETPPLVGSIIPQARVAEMEAFPRPNPPERASWFTDPGDDGGL